MDNLTIEKDSIMEFIFFKWNEDECTDEEKQLLCYRREFLEWFNTTDFENIEDFLGNYTSEDILYGLLEFLDIKELQQNKKLYKII